MFYPSGSAAHVVPKRIVYCGLSVQPVRTSGLPFNCDALTTLGSATLMIWDSRCKYGRVDWCKTVAGACCTSDWRSGMLPCMRPRTSPIVGSRELKPSLPSPYRDHWHLMLCSPTDWHSQVTHWRNAVSETHTHCVVEVGIRETRDAVTVA